MPEASKMYTSYCIPLIILLQSTVQMARGNPVVETNLGCIKGLAASDGNYSMFLGIPYGKVNASNPFGVSTEYGELSDEFEAYNDTAKCPQREQFNFTYTGTLDCLTLNIYVPNCNASNTNIPVLVWIHGGNFRNGFAGRFLFGPKFLVSHDIIVVTVNYRLGVYGFMCLDTAEVPGNQGFKDQQLALRWIRDNIESFGGDPDKITISGQSSGAASVDFHILFNTDNTFNSAIMQSGTTLSPLFFKPFQAAPLIIAAKLGLETNDTTEALTYLATSDTNAVIRAVNNLSMDNFGPCVEKEFEDVTRFVTKNWIEADVPQIGNMSILIGFNDNEMIANTINRNSKYYLSSNIPKQQLSNGFDVNNETFEEMDEIVKRFYFGDNTVNVSSKWDVIDLESDFYFNHPTLRSVEKYLNNDAGNIYLYVFCYNGTRNYIKRRLNITAGGADHADEIGYLFDISYMTDEPSEKDQIVIDYMTTMWANFVKYGNPTPETSNTLNVTWTPNTKDSSRYYLNISNELSMGTRPFHNRMSFWDLFYLANYYLQRIYPGGNVQG